MMEFMSLRALEIGTERRQEIALKTKRAARGHDADSTRSEAVVEARAEKPDPCATATRTLPGAWPSST